MMSPHGRDGAAAGRRARTPRTRGITLLELLVVLAILSLLLGTGLGVLDRLRPGGRETSRAMAGLLRSARLRASETGRPQVIRIDAARGTIRLASWSPLLAERFDEGVGLPGSIPGTLGAARTLDPGEEIPLEIPGAKEGERMGLRIELDLRRVSGSGAVVRVGKTLELDVEPDGSLLARARRGGASRLEAQTSASRLPEGRFVALAVTWLQGSLVIERGGVEEAREEDSRAAEDGGAGPWFDAAGVVVGDGEGDLDADVDELRVWALRGGDEVRVPPGARIAKAPEFVRIDPRGLLDRRRHVDPPRILLEDRGGESRTFLIDREVMLHEEHTP